MKRRTHYGTALAAIAAAALFCGGCLGQNSRSAVSSANENAAGSSAAPSSVSPSASSPRKVWTQEEIRSLFASSARETDWELIACQAVSDLASGRVGTVLFTDREQNAWVAFLDEDGVCQRCGTSSPLASEPEFAYLGNGTVSFRLQPPGEGPKLCRITFTSENGDVFWVREDTAEIDLNAVWENTLAAPAGTVTTVQEYRLGDILQTTKQVIRFQTDPNGFSYQQDFYVINPDGTEALVQTQSSGRDPATALLTQYEDGQETFSIPISQDPETSLKTLVGSVWPEFSPEDAVVASLESGGSSAQYAVHFSDSYLESKRSSLDNAQTAMTDRELTVWVLPDQQRFQRFTIATTGTYAKSQEADSDLTEMIPGAPGSQGPVSILVTVEFDFSL